jgi:hypothetical protein
VAGQKQTIEGDGSGFSTSDAASIRNVGRGARKRNKRPELAKKSNSNKCRNRGGIHYIFSKISHLEII